MTKINGIIMYYTDNMKSFSVIFVLIFALTAGVMAQTQDQLPVREYTNPEEMVTFDRTTPFMRVLDVLNEFAQGHRGKIIIDRSNISGELGISIPPMHWMDALKLILNVKQRQLVELPEYYEIVNIEQTGEGQQVSGNQQAQVAGAAGEDLIPTLGTREVRINAIFFEGNRRALREIGVDWSTLSNNVPDNVTDFTGGEEGGGGSQDGELPSQEFGGPFVQVNSRGAQNVSQNVFNALVNVGQLGNTGIEVQALFSAFEADNLGEILASPTVRVMDGQAGRVQVGQDFSIKQRDFAGNVTDNFVSVGTILEVTPQIIVHNDTTFIHVTLEAERSSAQPDPVSTIINKQEAQTQSLLIDGEATVIAGLYRTERSEVRRGIPILKDLPGWFFGLKYLFGYNADDYQMSELVVLLTASIEPTLEERYANRGNFANKFELLRDERMNSRREIRQREDAFDGKVIGDDKDLSTRSIDDEEEELSARVEEEEVEETQPENIAEEQDEVKNDIVTDPEIDTQEIPLNFVTPPEETDTAETGEDTGIADEADDQVGETEEPQKDEEESAEKPQNGVADYYIIGGSFGVEENANNFRDQLVNEGFNAVMLSVNGKHLVAYRGYSDLDEAEAGLADIRQYYNSGAWLYRVN